jgi:hypothetical protein
VLQNLTCHFSSAGRWGGPYPNPRTRLSQIGQCQFKCSTRPAVPQWAPAGHWDQQEDQQEEPPLPTPLLVLPQGEQWQVRQRVALPTLLEQRQVREHTQQQVAGQELGPGSRGTVAGLPMKRFGNWEPA